MTTANEVKEAMNIWEGQEPIPGKAVIIHAQTCCDMCMQPSLVDGKTKQGSWANMCLQHFHSHGIGLGIGKGQVLIWRKP